MVGLRNSSQNYITTADTSRAVILTTNNKIEVIIKKPSNSDSVHIQLKYKTFFAASMYFVITENIENWTR